MADGQVLIDSKLNVDGVEKGTKQIKQEMDQLADVSAKTAKKIARSFEDNDYKKAFDDLSDSAKKSYAKIEMIRSNDADDNKAKAAKIAAVYRELGDDQATAMKRAWAVVKDESAEGSHRVIDDLKEIGEKAEKTGKQIKGIGKGFKDVFGSDFLVHFLSDVAANAFDSLSDFIIDTAKQAVESAAEISAANAMFEQTFKGVEKSARKALQTISDETQISTTRMQTSFAKIFAFTKAVGGDTEKSMDIAARATRLAADNAAYFDTSIEDATETIYSFIKGNYENDAALNLVANEMSRNAAANERYGKSFQALNGLQQADTLLAMAEAANKASGAYGQAAREADSWANVTGELKEAWKQFTAVFGESAIETMTPVIQGITNALNEYLELRRKLEEKKNPVAEEFTEIEEAAPPVVDAIDEIAEAYANAKEAARDSLDSQIGYFEAVNLESDMSAQKIIENWQSQQEAFANYTANLQKAMDMGLDDILIKQLSDGTTESMIMLDALVNDYSVTADEINSSWNKTDQMRDTTAAVIAGIQEDLTGMTGAVGSAVVGSAESTKTGITNALTDAASTIQNTAFAPMEESGTATAEATSEAFDDAANTMKAAWQDMGPWFNANVVTPIKTGIEGITQAMSASLSSMKAETSSAWADMVSTVERSIRKMQSAIDGLTGKTIDVTVNKTGSGADLVSYSGYDGKAYSPEMESTPATAAYTPATLDITPKMPYLASGAVIPPMAIPSVSSRSSGMNTEDMNSLAEKIAAAVAVSIGTIDVNNIVSFEGSLAQLGRVLKPVIDTETRRTGKTLAVEKIE
jgi:hypothetical protein